MTVTGLEVGHGAFGQLPEVEHEHPVPALIVTHRSPTRLIRKISSRL
ncbi:hypothetical protein ACQP2F_10785 [Actinoplanes sp. CA-030573]